MFKAQFINKVRIHFKTGKHFILSCNIHVLRANVLIKFTIILKQVNTSYLVAISMFKAQFINKVRIHFKTAKHFILSCNIHVLRANVLIKFTIILKQVNTSYLVAISMFKAQFINKVRIHFKTGKHFILSCNIHVLRANLLIKFTIILNR